MDIANKVFIVTGGASGLGEGTARMLAREGGQVVIADLQAERGEALARELREFRNPNDGETRMFYEIVVAPGYTEDGLRVLKGKSKDLRILEAKPVATGGLALRQIGGGWLAQDPDLLTPEQIDFKVVTNRVPTAAEVRRWVAAVGRMRSMSFFGLVSARWHARLAHEPREAVSQRLVELRTMAGHAAFHEPVEVGDLAVTGEDLIRVGVTSGPEVGATLRRLLDFVLDDPARNQRELLLRRVTVDVDPGRE